MVNDLKTENKYIQKLKSSEVVLKFSNFGSFQKFHFAYFGDLSFVNQGKKNHKEHVLYFLVIMKNMFQLLGNEEN